MKKIFFAVLFFTVASFSFAKTQMTKSLFDSTWTEAQINSLERGEIVIRNIKKMKNVSIANDSNLYLQEMLSDFKKLSPSYLAEIIYKMPKEGNQNVYAQAVQIFRDVNLYKEIIYTDERKGKSRPLFPKVDILRTENSFGKIRVETHLQMDMLSDYDSDLVIRYGRNGFFFEQKNVDALKWRGITAVKQEKMVSGICCFEYEDCYYVYALGGIRAPRIPIVLDEIDRQFIGRIRDFTTFYIKRFDIKR